LPARRGGQVGRDLAGAAGGDGAAERDAADDRAEAGAGRHPGQVHACDLRAEVKEVPADGLHRAGHEIGDADTEQRRVIAGGGGARHVIYGDAWSHTAKVRAR
jgi:hypothetical protein